MTAWGKDWDFVIQMDEESDRLVAEIYDPRNLEGRTTAKVFIDVDLWYRHETGQEFRVAASTKPPINQIQRQIIENWILDKLQS
jgi:hypothetical protein